MGYPDELKSVLEALPRLTDKLEHFVSHRLPFNDVIDAFKIAAKPDSAKVMIRFTDATQKSSNLFPDARWLS